MSSFLCLGGRAERSWLMTISKRENHCRQSNIKQKNALKCPGSTTWCENAWNTFYLCNGYSNLDEKGLKMIMRARTVHPAGFAIKIQWWCTSASSTTQRGLDAFECGAPIYLRLGWSVDFSWLIDSFFCLVLCKSWSSLEMTGINTIYKPSRFAMTGRIHKESKK
jgi:hypothetical protein